MILGIIPARYTSTRFPGKVLVDIQGKSMVQRVYERARLAQRLDQVLVATDDERVFRHVQAFGGAVCMTKPGHLSGTERLAEVAAAMSDFDHYINIQGDEPFINPQQIDQLCDILLQHPDTKIATLMFRLRDSALLSNPNTVKVVVDHQGFALYFSRAPVPFCRGEDSMAAWLDNYAYYKHIGMYGFTGEVLRQIPQLPLSELEQIERLEQLRWLANGLKIRVGETAIASYSIDTPEDLQRVLQQHPEWLDPED